MAEQISEPVGGDDEIASPESLEIPPIGDLRRRSQFVGLAIAALLAAVRFALDSLPGPPPWLTAVDNGAALVVIVLVFFFLDTPLGRFDDGESDGLADPLAPARRSVLRVLDLGPLVVIVGAVLLGFNQRSILMGPVSGNLPFVIVAVVAVLAWRGRQLGTLWQLATGTWTELVSATARCTQVKWANSRFSTRVEIHLTFVAEGAEHIVRCWVTPVIGRPAVNATFPAHVLLGSDRRGRPRRCAALHGCLAPLEAARVRGPVAEPSSDDRPAAPPAVKPPRTTSKKTEVLLVALFVAVVSLLLVVGKLRGY